MHLLWADFGAGKTHTLRYIAQEARANRFPGLLPIYCALPKGSKRFLDIYRTVIRAVGRQEIAEAYSLAPGRVSQESAFEDWPDLWTAFKVVALGSEEQTTIAWNWLTATPGMGRAELAAVGLHGRIGSTDNAIRALVGVVRFLATASGRRVFLMIDEFQRVETLRDRDRDEINAGLHSLYNAAGRMSLVLSFSFGAAEHIDVFLNKELLDRADPVRLFIPHLSPDNALEFISDVIAKASEDPENICIVARRSQRDRGYR